ncbi:TetR/AcrR family transcriptional regulator [Frondihabitans peucedani]|uniref:TetR/AcrR family transcriptional regulator n=1 Tax=Frondihabitans peucedani TaxID=598626 RepID=A0ABP8E1B2_9MICO
MVRPRSFDKDTAVRSAEEVFRRTGYAGTSLDDITEATGLGRGSIYAAFGDKHGLFMEALGDYGTKTMCEIASALEGPDEEALGRLRQFVSTSPSFVLEDVDMRGCMAGKMAHELGGHDTEAIDKIASIFAAFTKLLVAAIEAAQRAGDIAADLDAGSLAASILAFTRGIDILAKGGVPADEVIAAAATTADLLFPLRAAAHA